MENMQEQASPEDILGLGRGLRSNSPITKLLKRKLQQSNGGSDPIIFKKAASLAIKNNLIAKTSSRGRQKLAAKFDKIPKTISASIAKGKAVITDDDIMTFRSKFTGFGNEMIDRNSHGAIGVHPTFMDGNKLPGNYFKVVDRIRLKWGVTPQSGGSEDPYLVNYSNNTPPPPAVNHAELVLKVKNVEVVRHPVSAFFLDNTSGSVSLRSDYDWVGDLDFEIDPNSEINWEIECETDYSISNVGSDNYFFSLELGGPLTTD